MAFIVQKSFSNAFLSRKLYFDSTSSELSSLRPIWQKVSNVWVMAWGPINYESLSEEQRPSSLRYICAYISKSNSLALGRFNVNFRWVILKLILVVNCWGISCETALIWVSLDHTYDKSTLFQVMAWCRQATSHYLSQCWPRSQSPYGVTRPQWVKCRRCISLTGRLFWVRSYPGERHILFKYLRIIWQSHTCLLHMVWTS